MFKKYFEVIAWGELPFADYQCSYNFDDIKIKKITGIFPLLGVWVLDKNNVKGLCRFELSNIDSFNRSYEYLSRFVGKTVNSL